LVGIELILTEHECFSVIVLGFLGFVIVIVGVLPLADELVELIIVNDQYASVSLFVDLTLGTVLLVLRGDALEVTLAR
jgi:membrane-bound ClpP family serine protease